MKITIFGDICPTKDTMRAFESGNCHNVFGEVLKEIDTSDIVIGNLECAVTDNPTPIQKSGPVLYTRSKAIHALKGFDVLSLANNHIRDCGDEGVLTALETCKNLGIKTLGAGLNLEAARQPLLIEKHGLKIGVMSFAEQEFNIANENRSGACYLDMYDDFDRIREFRKTVDYLIILYHGGIEYFPFASPELSRKCHKLVDCGADLVTCQHSHCIGTIEKYKDSVIVYGQGNSVFGYRSGDESWNQGLLLQVDIIDNNSKMVSYKGITATNEGLKFLPEEKQNLLEKQLLERETISAEDIEKEWNVFCEKLGRIHMPLLLGWPKLLIAINRRTNNLLLKLFMNKKRFNNTHNLIRCEAHREIIETLLKKKDYS